MKYHEMHEKMKTRGNKMGGSIGEGMGLAMLPPMLFLRFSKSYEIQCKTMIHYEIP